MRFKLFAVGVLLGVFALELLAMPTKEEAERTVPVVRKSLESEREALKSGKMSRSEVAEAALKLADEADSDAARMLLIKGAFVLYVKDGDLEKAEETMKTLKTAIPDIPLASITNVVEMALAEKNGSARSRLYGAFEGAKANSNVKKAPAASLLLNGNGTGLLGQQTVSSLRERRLLRQRQKADELARKAERSPRIADSKETVDGITWSYRVKNGEATIVSESNGEFSCAASPAPRGELVIPSTLGGAKVTGLGKHALMDSNVESVTIPEGVKDIGHGAFAWIGRLKSVSIPSSVTNIAAVAFISSGVLKRFAVAVGNGFYSSRNGLLCSKDGAKVIAGVNGEVVIPDCVTEIGSNAFHRCTGLKSVTIPNGVERVCNQAFFGCEALSEVKMLGERPDAPDEVFEGCANLKAIHVPANAKSWAGMKEWQGKKLVFDVLTGNEARGQVEKDRQDAEREAQHKELAAIDDESENNATKVQWHYEVVDGEIVLGGHGSLAVPKDMTGDLVIPEKIDGKTVSEIANGAFLYCFGLTSVTIPKSVVRLNGNVFAGCRGITRFSVSEENPKYASINGMICTKDGKTVVSGINGDVIIPDGVTAIGRSAFYYYHGLKTVVFPSSLKSIDVCAFNGCFSLKEVKLPDGIVSIGDHAFGDCGRMESISVPASAVDIGECAFPGPCLNPILVSEANPKYAAHNGILCSKDGSLAISAVGATNDVIVPDTVTRICDSAFYKCTRMTSVNIPAGVTDISDSAFTWCGKINAFHVSPENQKYASINNVLCSKDGKTLIAGINGDVVVPDGVTTIVDSSFTGRRDLTSVTIPPSVTMIGKEAFRCCSRLKSVKMLGERPDTGRDPFAYAGLDSPVIHVPANAKSWAGMKEWQGKKLVFDANGDVSATGESAQECGILGCLKRCPSDAKELTLGVEDGLSCNMTLVEIPGNGSIAEFAMSKYEITQEQYEKIMGKNPSTVKGAQLPVNNVTWTEAVNFCDRLNSLIKREHLKFTLPTCAQWYYAAKGGEDFRYPGSDDPDEVSWTLENSGETPHPIGGKKPNGYGLHDMGGNVREWGRSSVNDAEWQPILGDAAFYRRTRSNFWRCGIGALTRNCRQPSNGFRVVVINELYIERLIAAVDKRFSAELQEGTAKKISLAAKTDLDLIKVPSPNEDCYLGRFEITQAQYETIMGENPSGFTGGNLPVDSVSWHDAMKFCDKLNDKFPVRGMKWSLPTADIWRSAEQTAGPSYHLVDSKEIDDVAWYCLNAGGKTHPVGLKIPNGGGYFDMSGNVAEWCLDAGTLAGRVILGGGWNCVDAGCSVGDCGNWMMPDQRDQGVGFRVCLIPESRYAKQKLLLKDSAGFTIESKSVDFDKDIRIVLNKIPGEDYWFAISELTQGQYESIMGQNPSEPKGVDLPVVNVSWMDALTFCEKLNEKFPQDGLKWTLPTSKQWNYAASGGQKFLFSGGGNIDEVGWFGGNSGGRIHPVCQKKPNAFGLYDMTGNARELYIEARQEHDMLFANPSCWSNGNLGLSMLEVARCFSPDGRNGNVGFRVVLIPSGSLDVAKVSKIASNSSLTAKDRKTADISVVQGLQTCEFLLNKDFKRNAKYYLCLFSASWCGPCRAEMPRIAKTYAEKLKDDPDIELIHFSCDQNDKKALAWAKEHNVKFPVVKPNGGNPLNLHPRGIPHLFIVKADGTLVEDGHPTGLFTEEKIGSLK